MTFKTDPHSGPAYQRGFSLVELVVVIVVLGIISAGTAIYITRSMEAYSDTVRRDLLTSTSRVAVERIVRELRNALPNSIRINSNTAGTTTTHCLEFFPIKRSSAYIDIPVDTAAATLSVIPFPAPASAAFHVVVYPHTTGSLYTQPVPGPIKSLDYAASDPANGLVQLTAAHRFDYHSAQKRFFLVHDPVSFCIDTNQQLRHYSDYGINSTQSVPPAAGTNALLAEQIQLNDGGAITPFNFDPGTLLRAGVVSLDLRFMQENEWLRLRQEVQIRNVP